MRKPRDLDKYCNKADALALVEELRQMVEQTQQGSLFRIKVDLRKWHPSWTGKS